MLQHVEQELEEALTKCAKIADSRRTVTVRGDVKAIAQQTINTEVKKAIDDCIQRSVKDAKFNLLKLTAEAEVTVKAAGQNSAKAVVGQMRKLQGENDRVLAALEHKRVAAETFVSENKALTSELEDLSRRVQSYREKLEKLRNQNLADREKPFPICLIRARPAEAALEILALNFKPQKFADLSISLTLDTGQVQFISISPVLPGAQIIYVELSSFQDPSSLQCTVVDSRGDALSKALTITMADDNPQASRSQPPGEYYAQEVPSRAEEEVQALALDIAASFPTAGTAEAVATWIRNDPTLTHNGACQLLMQNQHQPDEAFQYALQVQQHYPTVDLAQVARWFRQDPAITMEAMLSYLGSQHISPQ